MAIRDGRVTTIKENRTDTAERVFDAEGKIVTPCFIDIHTHSDFTLPLNPKADEKSRQGVMIEVVGNCGFSVAPALPEKGEKLRAYLFGSAPWLPFKETNFANYMHAWTDIAVNKFMQVGQNTLRLMAIGMEGHAPNNRELLHFQEMLEEGLNAGALRFSSGLFTAPGCLSEPDVLHPLGSVLERYSAR